MSAAKRGKPQSAEHRAKVKASTAVWLSQQPQHFNFGRKASVETRAKMSDAHRGRGGWHLSDATKQKLREAHLGKKLSLQHRARIALAGVGRKPTEETRRKLGVSVRLACARKDVKSKRSTSQMGHAVSAETRRKIGLTRLGKRIGPPSQETREKIRRANTGRIVSVETRRKLSIAGRGRKMTEAQHAALLQRIMSGRGGHVKGKYKPTKTSNRELHHYRSGLELLFMRMLDSDDDVTYWEYESTCVPCGTTHTVPDFIITRLSGVEVVEAKGKYYLKAYLEGPRHPAVAVWARAHSCGYRVFTENGYLTDEVINGRQQQEHQHPAVHPDDVRTD